MLNDYLGFVGLSKTDACRCVREKCLRSSDAKLHGNSSCVLGSGQAVLGDRLTCSGRLIGVLHAGWIADLS